MPLSKKVILSACGRYIYHIVIIDYFQTYDLNKKMERLSKYVLLKANPTAQFGPQQLSVLETNKYAERFISFIKNKVLVI